MNEKAKELQERTRRFASRVIKYCEKLPKSSACHEIADQLVDAASSTDSNYRATCRARSRDEFIAKIGVAAEEADEAKGWLLLLVQSDLATIDASRDLIQEADELTAIFVKSRKTAKERQERERLARRAEAARCRKIGDR